MRGGPYTLLFGDNNNRRERLSFKRRVLHPIACPT